MDLLAKYMKPLGGCGGEVMGALKKSQGYQSKEDRSSQKAPGIPGARFKQATGGILAPWIIGLEGIPLLGSGD